MKIKQVVVTGQNQVALQDDLLEDRPLADDEVLRRARPWKVRCLERRMDGSCAAHLPFEALLPRCSQPVF